MIRVAVAGAAGRMGQTVCEAVEAADDMELAGKADPALGVELADVLGEADVVVDFTVPDTALGNVRACLEAGVHAVVGTTGFDLDAARAAAEASSANCFVAPNFAIGAVLLMEVAQTIAPHMPECEIVELHHDRKLDAPSGTAKRTAGADRRRRRQRPRADPLGPAARPGRPPGSDLRRRGPDALDPPRLDRPPLLHARRAARRAQGRRRCPTASPSASRSCSRGRLADWVPWQR